MSAPRIDARILTPQIELRFQLRRTLEELRRFNDLLDMNPDIAPAFTKHYAPAAALQTLATKIFGYSPRLF
jgi:hypothetical protein